MPNVFDMKGVTRLAGLRPFDGRVGGALRMRGGGEEDVHDERKGQKTPPQDEGPTSKLLVVEFIISLVIVVNNNGAHVEYGSQYCRAKQERSDATKMNPCPTLARKVKVINAKAIACVGSKQNGLKNVLAAKLARNVVVAMQLPVFVEYSSTLARFVYELR